MDKSPNLTKRQRLVLAALAGRSDGVPASEIARSMGLTTCYASEVLRSLRDLGWAACSSSGRFARWGQPEAIVALRATNAAAAAQSAQARAAARKEMEAIEADAYSALQMVHHLTKAVEAPPFKGPGPASVFHIATWHNKLKRVPCRGLPELEFSARLSVLTNGDKPSLTPRIVKAELHAERIAEQLHLANP